MQITEVKNVFVSILALVNENNEILIGKRPIHDTYAGYWEFPGGKIKNKEHPEEALIRESKEEIGINLEKSCLAPLTFTTFTNNNQNLILLLYVARKWNNTPSTNFHSELSWVKPNKLRDYKMPKANSFLIGSIQDLLL